MSDAFKFEIGQDVMHVGSKREADDINERRQKYTLAVPQRFVVIERMVQECYGGIQRSYGLRGMASVGGMEIITCIQVSTNTNGLIVVTEPELLPYASPAPKGVK